jgi:hypothetical protein
MEAGWKNQWFVTYLLTLFTPEQHWGCSPVLWTPLPQGSKLNFKEEGFYNLITALLFPFVFSVSLVVSR